MDKRKDGENLKNIREFCGRLQSGHFLYLRNKNTKLKINKMRTDVFLSGLVSVFMLVSCNSNIVFEDFESGSLSRWAAEGDAFANVPAVAADDSEVKGYNGEGFLKSLSDSAVQGSLTSEPFTIEKKYVNFLLGGTGASYTHSATSVNLVVDGEIVQTISSVGRVPSEMEWMSWDVAQYKGKEATITVVVNPARAMGTRVQQQGFVLVDDITFSNRNLSNYMAEYRTGVKIDKDYILIPGSLTGSSSRLSVEVDGVNILGTAQRVSLATDKVDYYIPVNVKNYKGKKAEVVLTGVRTSYAVYDNIETDDSMRVEYDEPYRPVYHFSPYFGWTNDPNGMVYKDGEWHLSYQYNPYGTTHGNMHWGHAVSKDLVSWEHHPFIVAPDELGSIFSGSSVVDINNTSGFGENAIVAIYTSAGRGQRQSIAWSLDDGRTYTKYEGNPVLSEPEKRDFRDPKVTWIDDQWVMSIAAGDVISFYGSKDLKNWTKLSDFGKGIGSHAAVWECPDLMKLNYNGKDKWVLLVSINPGGPNGGSVTQYFIGDFNGKEYKADPLPYPLWVDLGVDNYAGVTFGNTPGRYVFMGWMSNWWYANQTPTTYFRNSMTIPRDLGLKHNGKHLILASVPSPEIFAARGEEKAMDDMTVNGSWTLDSILEANNGAYEIDLTIVPETGKEFVLSLSNAKGEHADFRFDWKKSELVLDRSESGLTDFAPRYVTDPIVTPVVKKKEYKVQLFVDRLSTEMFVNDGDVVFTNCVFPTEALNTLTFKTDGKAVVKDFTVYEMKSTPN